MDLLGQIMEIAKDTFGDKGLQPENRIEEAKNFDSMNLVQFIIELESNLCLMMDDDEVKRDMSFTELTRMLETKQLT